MIRIQSITFLFLFASMLLWSCANQTQPTGGPKDEDPPILVSSIPESGTLNYNSQTIQLSFNELIKANNLQSELIITPSLKSKYKSKVIKNRLTLTFEEPLLENTTYTFNFRGAIQDVTESNPAEDLIIVFSTGAALDSLQITGEVSALLTNAPAENYTVALYQAEDTLNLFNSVPFYAIQTEKDGTFQFRNLKSDRYYIYAWSDKNNDLKCQSENEPYGFLLDPIQLDSNKMGISIRTQNLNLKPLLITAARQQGKYYEVRFTKRTTSYLLESIMDIDTIYHHYLDDKKALRIYNNQPPQTEYLFHLTATDSSGQVISDTLQFAFQQNSRPPEAFQSRIVRSSLKSTSVLLETEITFSKPIMAFSDTSWRLTTDSTTLKLSNFEPQWRWQNNNLLISATLPDSLTNKKDLSISFPINSFISIERDTSALMKQQVNHINPDDFGIIELTFTNDSIPFQVQLLNAKKELSRQYEGATTLTLEYLDAGQYTIRILIDANQDGKWDPGNFFESKQPEPVIFFYDQEAKTSTITLKKNWVLGPFNIDLHVENRVEK